MVELTTTKQFIDNLTGTEVNTTFIRVNGYYVARHIESGFILASAPTQKELEKKINELLPTIVFFIKTKLKGGE